MTINASGPGQAHRTGLSIMEVTGDLFPDDAAAEAWFTEIRWPDGIECPKCGSTKIQVNAKHKSMPYRCGQDGCRKKFSVKLGTVMEGSKLSYRKWALAIYYFCTNIKGISSMRLRRELGLHQRTAWFVGHRLREAYTRDPERFSGPVEADETMIGGKEKNKHGKKRLRENWPQGKTIVAAVVDRQTKMVDAAVVPDASALTLQKFVEDRISHDAKVYTDEAKAYKGMKNKHESVNHSAGEYVKGDAHTNSAEGLFSMLDRAIMVTFHKLSPKHMDHYVQEFAQRKNDRHSDTYDQMGNLAAGMLGKRLKLHELIAPNGKSNYAKPERKREN